MDRMGHRPNTAEKTEQKEESENEIEVRKRGAIQDQAGVNARKDTKKSRKLIKQPIKNVD